MAFSAPEPGAARTDAEQNAAEPDLTTDPVSTDPVPVDPPLVDPGAGEPPRNPLLAALGAGDAAVAAVARAFADAYAVAASRQKTVQQRVADLPAELEQLRERFSGEDLRRALESYRSQVERAYVEFAGRGEEAWERLRELVPAEKVAQASQRLTGRAADTVVDASAAAADAVEDAGTAAAGAIEDAGEETATVTRKATRRTTSRRAPRRSGPASGSPGPSGG